MDKKQLKDLIESTLKDVDLYSEDATNLIMGTIAQESAFGTYIRQLYNGPAIGIVQMEPATHDWLKSNYLAIKPNLVKKIIKSCGIICFKTEYLEYNLKYAIIFCRLRYLVVKEPLPNNLHGYAKYWKKYYNTELGKGTVDEFISNYKKFVL